MLGIIVLVIMDLFFFVIGDIRNCKYERKEKKI